jgi:hypothetical protein
MTPTIRSIKDTDLDALRRLFFRLSPETIYRRFFTLYSRPPEEALRHLCFVDHHDRVAFVADVDGDLVGVARFDRVPGTTEAEVAVVV